MQGKIAALALLVLIGTAPAASADASPSIASVQSVLYGPEPLDAFRSPEGILADRERGIFLVSDTGNCRLVIFDRQWRNRGAIEFRPGPDGEPSAPRQVAVDPRGRLFVVDMYRTEIEIMTSRGNHLGYLPTGISEDVLSGLRPQDIEIDPRGTIYVLYAGERPGIEVLSAKGVSREQIGFEPAGEGLFTAPTAIAVRDGEIAVVDAQTEDVIRILSPQGKVLAAFGRHGEGEATFSIPVHVAWGPGETLWVTDTRRHSISAFKKNGFYLGRIGGFGRGPGQLYYPVACGFLAEDRVLVLERAGARLQVLEINPLDVASTNAGLE